MSYTYDATLKDIVAEHPGDFAAAFGMPTGEPTTALNVDLSTLSAATDVVLGFGDPMREIADVNFQSGPDPGLPARLHLYNAALHARYELPVRSILVLLRPKADAANLLGKLAYGLRGQRVRFEYSVVRLWQESPHRFLVGGLSMLPLATLCQMPTEVPLAETLRAVVLQIERRLWAETSQAEGERLMKAACILTGLRVKFDLLTSIFNGVGLMQEMTAFDELMESESRGERRGERRGRQRSLLRQGRRRFGEVPPLIEAELTAIEDLDRLDRLADAILTATSWQDLLATP